MKILLTYGSASKDDFTSMTPEGLQSLSDCSVDAIEGTNVLQLVPSLIKFLEQCYRTLRDDGTCTFHSPYYASSHAWSHPLAVRGLNEGSLNFSSKPWRDENKFTDVTVQTNFDVSVSFAVEQDCVQRSEDARAFWMRRYNNVVQTVVYTLTKKPL